MWLLRVTLSQAHHLAHLNNDFRKWESVLLLCCHLRPDGEPERVDERKKSFVVPGYEITRQAGNGTWRVFHAHLGGGKASPVAPGCCS